MYVYLGMIPYLFIDIFLSVKESSSIFSNPSLDDDAYYDGDQQAPQPMDLFQSIDCSSQCAPYWTEPVLQQKQTLVYPTSASVSFRCPYQAKPKANIIWLKDGHMFVPELSELVTTL